ncbi:LFG3 protein, partial [Nyctibius grandis]|nr:LFG3 protein [Nyctibius grandis]
MAQPNAPPPYDDKNPLYLPPPGGYPQPSHYAGGYPQPGGYPAPGGYAQPGGYPAAGGYPQPGMAMPTMPIRFGVSPTAGDDGIGDGSPLQSSDWDRKVRHTFIRKASPEGLGAPVGVYAIISLQLLVTVGIIAVFTFVSPLSAVFVPRRRFPWNIILLSIFTLAMGLMTGTIASMYRTNAVLIAMLITAIVAIIVTIFCFQTKVRRGHALPCPRWGQAWSAGWWGHPGLPVTCVVPRQVPWLHMLYAAIGAIAFTLFLAYDTQLVLGNRKNTLSPEEYIYGALTIYTDIVYIFTFILQIVGRD